MCQINITKYSGCGCEIYEVVARCSLGDGSGNCSGKQRYSRSVKDGVCGRAHCAYYINYKPHSRWAANKPTGDDSSSKKPTHPEPGHQEASTRDDRQMPRPQAPNAKGSMTECNREHQF